MTDSNMEEVNMPWWGWLIIILVSLAFFTLIIHTTAKTTTQVIDKSQQRHTQITQDENTTLDECVKAFPTNVDARSKCIQESQKSSGWQHSLEDISDTVLGYQAIQKGV